MAPFGDSIRSSLSRFKPPKLRPHRLKKCSTKESINSAEEIQIPPELHFLREPECNPNLMDPQIRKIGYVRSQMVAAQSTTTSMNVQNRRFGLVRQIVGLIVLSWPAQLLMMLVIVGDFTLTIVKFTDVVEQDHQMFEVGDHLVLILLSIDVLGRLFVIGLPFFHSKLNIFELALVPITMTEVIFLKRLQDVGQMDEVPLPLLRAIRPILRGIRIIRVLVRTLGKGASYVAHLRRQVSGDRVRFVQDGFDLDLAYISVQVIAMSVPGAGYERLLRNPYNEVARFMNERHANKYLILNTCEDRRYPMKPFFGRYFHFPIPKQGVPAVEELWKLCQILDCFLKADPEHILAVHSYYGQGRTSLIIIALLLYRGVYPTVSSCISYFEHNRARQDNVENTTQTLDNASQHRFLEYFAQRCRTRDRSDRSEAPDVAPEAREVKLRRITLQGTHNAHLLDVSCFMPCMVAMQKARSVTRDDIGSHLDVWEGDLSERKLNLVERMRLIIEEGSFDSPRAGCLPMQGRPNLSSRADPGACPSITPQHGSTNPLEPGVWEVDADGKLRGEIRLEFYRRASDLRKMTGDTEIWPALESSIANRCLFWRRQCAQRGTNHTGGMVFSCWLHTSYLEFNELSTDGRSPEENTSPHLVTVELDRFALDKAANGPTLRSHSSTLKLQIEFEVGQRRPWQVVEEEDIELEASTGCVSASVGMPEQYSLQWLTFISKRVWPSFTSGFELLIRQNLTASLNSMKGPLKNVRLAQCSFGDSYPHFGHISACSRTVTGLEVQLDISLSYSTATNIVLEAGLVSFGISHLKFSGVLSIRFTPILAALPVFAAMQILFLNLPEVDLKFARNLGEISNVSVVRNLIFGAINNALCDFAVVPNIVNISWADPNEVKAVSFRNVSPVAILRLSVIEARGLTSESSVFKRAPDAFVKVQIGAQVTQTPVIAKNTDPVWGSEFDFLIYDQQQHINVSVFDVDYSGRTHPIGSVPLMAVLSLVAAGGDGLWSQLTLKIHGISKPQGGEVLLMGALFDIVADKDGLQKYLHNTSSPLSKSSVISVRDPTMPEEDPEEPEEPEDEELTMDPWNKGEMRSGAVALLVLEVFGGHCPVELAAPSALSLKVGLGKAHCIKRCVDAQTDDPNGVSPKIKRSIERLANFGFSAEDIADSLAEDVSDVKRIMRQRAWNVQVPQKVCVLAWDSDLHGAPAIEISLIVKKTCVAVGSVPMRKILEAPGLKYQEVISCKPTKLKPYKVELDAEMRMFALKPQALVD